MPKKPAAAASGDAEAGERRRLRSMAFSNGLLQRGEPAPPRSALAPSSAVARLQGRDIVRRGGQRKSRFLFSFPGLLAPAAAASAGGRVGELADLGTKNPVLYLEFPQGRMKLLGTHVYPKNKYLTLQMTRSAKGVVCEDVFESLIVFSEAWWIGTKEENPDELKLEFPKDLQNDGEAADCDFKGGAGATSVDAITCSKPGNEITEPLSPKLESDGDASEDSDHKNKDGTQTTSGTPVRQSARTAGKALKYAELSSEGDSAGSDNEIEVPEDLDEKMKIPEIKKEIPSEDIKPADSSAHSLSNKKEPLVQASLSSMFKKAEERKRSTRSPKGSSATKGPAAKKQRACPKGKQSAGKKEVFIDGAMPPRKRPLEPSEAMPSPLDVKAVLPPPDKPAAAAVPPISAAILNNLPGPEREVYKRVYATGNKGMWSQDLRYAMQLASPTLTKLTRALVQRGILKEVTDVRHRGKKVFMDARIEPSPEITGGTWYHNGQLDSDAVAAARRRCLDQVDRLGAATPDMVHKGVERDDPRAGYGIDQIREVLRTMALDRVLEECRSTGEGEFSAVRAGRVCYRRGGAPQGGMMEGIPCGVCPRIDECSPEGVISPTTCQYYKKWLQMDF